MVTSSEPPSKRPEIFPTRLIPGSAATLLRMEAVTNSSSFFHTRTSLMGRLPVPVVPAVSELHSASSQALSVLCTSPSLRARASAWAPAPRGKRKRSPVRAAEAGLCHPSLVCHVVLVDVAPGRPHPCPVCLHAEPFPLSSSLAVSPVLHHSDASSSLVTSCLKVHDDPLAGPRPFLVPRTSPQSSSLLPPTLLTVSGADTGLLVSSRGTVVPSKLLCGPP